MSARNIDSLSDAGPMVATILVRRGMQNTLAATCAPPRFLSLILRRHRTVMQSRVQSHHLAREWPIDRDATRGSTLTQLFVVVLVVVDLDAEIRETRQQAIAHRFAGLARRFSCRAPTEP